MEIIVRKAARSLEVWESGTVIKSYRIVLGSCPIGIKEIEGDGKTPEGEYFVAVKNEKSKFHLSLGLSYPSREDAARAVKGGLIGASDAAEIEAVLDSGRLPPQKTALGGEIYIHGGGTAGDWTQGCIALENSEMEELFALAEKGTKVTIVP